MADFLMLDLKDIFNHKLIGTYEGDFWDYEQFMKTNYNLYNIGATTHVLHPDLLPDSLKCINMNEVSFVFPDKSINLYDNISCEGQVISIEQGRYSSIHLLGMSEWDNIYENIKLNFSDSHSESIDIVFRDWNPIGNSSWEFDRISPSCTSILQVEDNIGVKKHIYHYNLNISSNNKFLNSIKLPFNPCIHILSISLCHMN